MHDSSRRLMKDFFDRYLDKENPLNILDVGSYSVCGSYRDLLDSNWNYIGLDMTEGPNVDIVPSDIYNWKEIKEESFDVVISGQAFEHIEFPWITITEISRVLKQGGLVCIIAPSAGKEHRYPVDCYRYYPDGMRALTKWAKLEVLESYMERDPAKYPLMNKMWQDCILIAKKSNKIT
jgi:SAM-dependent methyltransferase